MQRLTEFRQQLTSGFHIRPIRSIQEQDLGTMSHRNMTREITEASLARTVRDSTATGCTSCLWVTQFIRHTSVIRLALGPIKSGIYRQDKTRRSRACSGEGSVKEALDNFRRNPERIAFRCVFGLIRKPILFCQTLQFRDQHCQEKHRKARNFEDIVRNDSSRQNL